MVSGGEPWHVPKMPATIVNRDLGCRMKALSGFPWSRNLIWEDMDCAGSILGSQDKHIFKAEAPSLVWRWRAYWVQRLRFRYTLTVQLGTFMKCKCNVWLAQDVIKSSRVRLWLFEYLWFFDTLINCPFLDDTIMLQEDPSRFFGLRSLVDEFQDTVESIA